MPCRRGLSSRSTDMMWSHLLSMKDESCGRFLLLTILIVRTNLRFFRASFHSQCICRVGGLACRLSSLRCTPELCKRYVCKNIPIYDKTIGKKRVLRWQNSYFSGVVCHCDVVWIQKSAEFRCDCRRLNVKCESLDLNIAILWSVDDKEAAVGVVDAVRIKMEIYCGSFKVGKYEILPEQSISNNGTMILFHKLAIVTVEA